MSLRLTPYGRREVVICTIASAVSCAVIALLAWAVSRWLLALLPAILAGWLWMLWFFRDPERAVPDEDGVFLSPADGRIADIGPVGPDGALGREGLRIGVFMGIFDVHVNRSPCDGRVESIEHRRGAFLDARRPQAAGRNESATILLLHPQGGRDWPVVIRQVAGLIARRIVTDLTEGQTVRRGQRIGMIKFGSRLELAVPRELVGEVRVKVGQKVRAGRSVLIAAREATGES